MKRMKRAARASSSFSFSFSVSHYLAIGAIEMNIPYFLTIKQSERVLRSKHGLCVPVTQVLELLSAVGLPALRLATTSKSRKSLASPGIF